MKLVEGQFYRIDKGFSNSGKVKLVWLGETVCIVQDSDGGETWRTMPNRLSEWIDSTNKKWRVEHTGWNYKLTNGDINLTGHASKDELQAIADKLNSESLGQPNIQIIHKNDKNG